MALVVIFISFIAGITSLIAAGFIMLLLQHMNALWKKRAAKQLPHTVAKRGLLLASGPALLTLFCILRIFIVLRTGHDVSIWWGLLCLLGAGVYCLAMSAFIFTVFEEMYKLHGMNTTAGTDKKT